MSQPDLYATAAQVILVLFLAILFELRLIAPFLRRLMDNEIKLGLLNAAERKKRTNPAQHLPQTRLFDMSTTHLNLKNHRTVWAPYKFYLYTAQLIDRSEWTTEVRYYERRRRLIFLGVYSPIAAGAFSLVACVAALSFDEPPAIFAAIVLPGIAGLTIFFFVMLVGIVKVQSAATRRAAWEVLNLVVDSSKVAARPEKYVAVDQEEASREVALRDLLR